MGVGLVIALVFAIAGTFAKVKPTITEEQLLQYLTKPQTPERFASVHGPGYVVQEFSLKTCNKTAPLQGTLSVTPDPIKIPGNVSVAFKGYAGVSVTSPTKAVLKVEKKFGIWVEIPCVENVGSCTYDDGCSMIPFKAGDPCPPPLSTYNLPCTCPFPKGPYNLPLSEITIPNTGLPEWLTDGDYKVNIKLYNKQDDQLACFDAAFSLTA